MTDSPADRFAAMAERIAHNASSTFGGAFVIVPPGESDPVEILLLDASPNPAAFWGIIQAKAQMALADMEEKQRRLQGHYR